MGRVQVPFGVNGWIKARPFTASTAALLDYGEWWLAPTQPAGPWQKFRVLAARCHSDSVLAQLDGVTNREAAATWRGALIGVPRAALPTPAAGEFYWNDLIGLAVVNRAGADLGHVVEVLDTGAHPVLRVAPAQGMLSPGGERLIPLVPAYVDTIDPSAESIVVDWQLDY